MEWLLSQELKDGQELGRQRVEEDNCLQRDNGIQAKGQRSGCIKRPDAYIRKET